jgi:dihydrofolate synthase/folylpolyglutamate synthase
VENAALVLAAVDVLRRKGWRISTRALHAGLMNVRWPGRCQWFRRRGGASLLFDGAHNPQAVERLIQTLASSPFSTAPVSFVFSVYRDKDVRSMAAIIARRAARVFIAPLPGPRGLDAASIAEAFRPWRTPVTLGPTPALVLTRAMRETPSHGLVVVTGSLALVGALLEPFRASGAFRARRRPSRSKRVTKQPRIVHV